MTGAVLDPELFYLFTPKGFYTGFLCFTLGFQIESEWWFYTQPGKPGPRRAESEVTWWKP